MRKVVVFLGVLVIVLALLAGVVRALHADEQSIRAAAAATGRGRYDLVALPNGTSFYNPVCGNSSHFYRIDHTTGKTWFLCEQTGAYIPIQ